MAAPDNLANFVKMNKAGIIASTIVGVTGAAIFATALLRMTAARDPYVDVPRDEYPVVGVDLSAHNGRVDFGRVAADGVDFVVLKATEGVSFCDSEFARNYGEARTSGLKVGAYHFFRFDCEGDRQARHFLSVVDSLDLDLPLAIDVEDNGNPDDINATLVAARLGAMINSLDSAGRKVMIYSNKRGISRYISGRFDDRPVWICSFTNPPLAGGRWTLWQHSHRSRVDGIKGDVDLNTFNGDSADWTRWLAAFEPTNAMKHNK